jgi:Ca-activated chloride channel family protein
MDGWGNPGALYWLLSLLPIAGGIVWGYRFRRRAIERLGPGASRLATDRSPVASVSRAVLLFLGFALLILSAARPQEAGQARPAKARGVDVVLALDISRSMLAQDVRPSRLERAKAELGAMLDRLRGHRVALVAFAGAAFVQCPLTTDVDAAKLFLRALDPREMPIPGTSLSRALSTSIDLLKEATQKTQARGKAILLLTDGEGHDEDPLVEAKLAKEKGIVVHTVGFGTEGGGPSRSMTRRGGGPAGRKTRARRCSPRSTPSFSGRSPSTLAARSST